MILFKIYNQTRKNIHRIDLKVRKKICESSYIFTLAQFTNDAEGNLKNIGINIENRVEIFVSCKNLPIEENNLIIKTLQEFLDPIENPRYILIKRNKIFNTLKQTDYFAVPSILCQNKKDVKVFQSLWEKHIGKCETQYTRNIEGRQLLLKARKRAFSATKRDKTKKFSKWQ